MKLKSLITAVLAVSVLFSIISAPAWGLQARQGDLDRGRDRYKKRDYVVDKRYNHNRRYPRPGLRVKRLPPNAHYRPYRSGRYYYRDGVWYSPVWGGYSVVRPPIGMTIRYLPPYYTTIWVGGIPYYYVDGIYYVWRSDPGIYVVTDPPPESEVSEEPPQSKRLYIYPKTGQSEEQQETDRYECHRWSAEQTGFDPTRPAGNVTAEQHADQSREYQRAMKACLEARDYSVQ